MLLDDINPSCVDIYSMINWIEHWMYVAILRYFIPIQSCLSSDVYLHNR